jgi:cell division protein FtsQ
MKRLVNILLGIFIITYLLVVLGFVRDAHDGIRCNGIDVVIKDSLEHSFINESDIRNLIRLEHPKIAGIPLSGLDAAEMEESLTLVPVIKSAQVYKTVEGRLVIEVAQRTPVIRVEDRDHRQYFLDREGNVIPAAAGYAPHILPVNGEIDGAYSKQKNVLEGGAALPSDSIMNDIIALANYIAGDPFWNAQIVQVYVNREKEFELVPRVGAQIILFGDGSRLEQKFFKLETMYREGFRQKGWNNYEIINLKYNHQVICTKR